MSQNSLLDDADRYEKEIDQLLKKCDSASKFASRFPALPPHLRQSIVKKCDFFDFYQLCQCSRSSHEICKTTKKITLKVNQVELETDRWQLIRPGILRNLVATTENLKNVILVTEKLTVKSPLTEDMCLFLMSQMNAKELSVNDGLECSQDLLQDLIQTLRLKTIQLNLKSASLDMNLDVSQVDTVRIENVNILSTQNVFNLNPKKTLSFLHFVTSDEVMQEIIESKSTRLGCETSFWSRNMSRSRFYKVMATFGNRAKLVETKKNCWTISDEKSNKPTLWVFYSEIVVRLMNQEHFKIRFGK